MDKLKRTALKGFQRNEVTAWKAARIAGVPLTQFLDILKERELEFHYTKEELREDIKHLEIVK